jgi:4-oxalocrotonate tautomerase
MENEEITSEFGAGFWESESRESDFQSVLTLVRNYFDGLYNGEVKKLRSISHSDLFLKAPGSRRSLDQWLDDVASRPTPYQQGLPYNFKLLSIEIINDQAMVKLECPLFDHQYIDYLGLLKEDRRWLIVSKMYIDLQKDFS